MELFTVSMDTRDGGDDIYMCAALFQSRRAALSSRGRLSTATALPTFRVTACHGDELCRALVPGARYVSVQSRRSGERTMQYFGAPSSGKLTKKSISPARG